MSESPDIQRPPKELIEGLKGIGSATAAGELSRLGVRSPHIVGPVCRTPGKSIVGPALDFCLVTTQRRHVDDTGLVVDGDAARDWMEKAQLFAGPPSDGPAPRST